MGADCFLHSQAKVRWTEARSGYPRGDECDLLRLENGLPVASNFLTISPSGAPSTGIGNNGDCTDSGKKSMTCCGRISELLQVAMMNLPPP